MNLDDLVVRMVGDGSDFKRMCNAAQADAKQAAHAVGGIITQVEQSVGSLGNLGRTAIGAITPLLGIGSVMSGLFKGVSFGC